MSPDLEAQNSVLEKGLLFASLIFALSLSSCGFVLETVSEKSRTSVPAALKISMPLDNNFTNQSQYTFNWSSDSGAENFIVTVFHGPDCTGTSGSPVYWVNPQFQLAGLQDAGTYSVQVAGVNAQGTGPATCSKNVLVDLQSPSVVLTAPSASTSVNNDTYSVQWTGSDQGISGLETSDTYSIQVFSNGTCAGTPDQTLSQIASQFQLGPMSEGTTSSIQVIARDRAGNSSPPVCSPGVTYSLLAPSLALADPMTLSTVHARQVGINIQIGNDSAATKWCVSETQTNAPASGNAACNGSKNGGTTWFSSRPSAINLSAGDGAKTVYIWIANGSNVVVPHPVNASISLDTTLPATPTAVIADTNSASSSATNQSTVNLTITGDTDAVKWLVIEQASATAAPAAPLFSSGSWLSARPTTQILTATGNRTIYVYTKDIAENVSSPAATATINYSTTALSDPTLALTDTTSSSATHTNDAVVSVAIGSDATAVKWCLSETQATKPALGSSPCSGGTGTQNGWLTTRPTTFQLSTPDGNKTVYLWIADQFNTVNGGVLSDSIFLDTGIPAPSGWTIASPANAAISNDETPQITVPGSGSEMGSIAKVFLDSGCGTQVGANAVLGVTDSTFTGISFATDGSADGTKTFYGTITDAAGNVSSCTALLLSYTFDRTAPTVLSVTSSTGDGTYGTGGSIVVTITFSSAVTVTGVPQLQLETGSTDAVVNYSSGTTSATLVFNYAIGDNETSADLQYQATTSLSLNGGSIADSAGNSATLALPALASASSLGGSKNIVVTDTQTPAAPSGWTMSSPANATLSNDATPTITIPAITTEAGSSARVYSESSCTTPAGSAVVVSGSTTVSVTDISYLTNGTQDGAKSYWGKIVDGSSNVGPCGALSLGYTLDTISPTVLDITSSTANGRYGTGAYIDVHVTFSEAIVVSGYPYIVMETGTVDTNTGFPSGAGPGGSGTTIINWVFVPVEARSSADLDYISTTPVLLNAGSLRDGAGNNATLTFPAPGTAGSLGANKNLEINGYSTALAWVADGDGGTIPNLWGVGQYGVMSPDEAFVYWFNTTNYSEKVSVFTRNATTGQLTFLTQYSDNLNYSTDASHASFSPDGKFIYLSGGNLSAVKVIPRDTTTGLLSPVTHSYACFNASATKISADGLFLYLACGNGVQVYSVNTTTGALTLLETQTDAVNGVDGLIGVHRIFLSPSQDDLYVTTYTDKSIVAFRRDPSSGLLTYTGNVMDGVDGVNYLNPPGTVTFSSDGLFAYVPASNSQALNVFSRNASTGALSLLHTYRHGVGGITLPSWPPTTSISPDGNFVYALGHGISGFSRNATTGLLTQISSIASGRESDPMQKAIFIAPVTSDGSYLYTFSSLSGSITAFNRNLGTGILTLAQFVEGGMGGGFYGLTGGNGIAHSPGGEHLYISSYQESRIAVATRNTTTGALTSLQTVEYGVGVAGALSLPGRLTLPADGKNVYVTSYDSLTTFTRDTGTGLLTFLGYHPHGGTGGPRMGSPRNIVVSPDDKHVYVTAHSSQAVSFFSRDATTGALTYESSNINTLGGITGMGAPSILTISPDGKHVYVASSSTGVTSGIAIFSRDSSTGTLTYISTLLPSGGFLGVGGAEGMGISPDNAYLYLTSGTNNALFVFSRNTTSGALTFIESQLDAINAAEVTGPGLLSLTSDGAYVIATANGSSGVSIFERNSGTGTLRAIEYRAGTGYSTQAFSLSPDNKFLYFSGSTGGYDSRGIGSFRLLPF